LRGDLLATNTPLSTAKASTCASASNHCMQ
jgi:hypothetical protein